MAEATTAKLRKYFPAVEAAPTAMAVPVVRLLRANVMVGTVILKPFVITDEATGKELPAQKYRGVVIAITAHDPPRYKVLYDKAETEETAFSETLTWVNMEEWVVSDAGVDAVSSPEPGGEASLNSYLKLELAVSADAGTPFVRATALLEGSSADVFLNTYDDVIDVQLACQTRPWPNVRAVVRELSGGDEVASTTWMQYALRCFEGAHTYFTSKFDESVGDLASVMKCAKVVRIFRPHRANQLCPDGDTLLKHFTHMPFIPTELRDALMKELPAYLASARDARDSTDVLDWWSGMETTCPSWFLAFRIIMAIAPSSAETERVFSMMRNTLTDRQDLSLRDYCESVLMLRYNERQRSAGH